MEVQAEADVCYLVQNYPLRIPILQRDDAALEANDKAFRAEHRCHYGFASETEPTVVLNLRFTAIGRVERPRLKSLAEGGADSAAGDKARRHVIFDRPFGCPIYDRDQLLAVNVILGPTIFEQMDTTVLLPPGLGARVDRTGTLVATVRAS